MTHNPYAPPSATVTDVEQESLAARRSWQVTWAVRAAVLSLLIALPQIIHGILTADDPDAGGTAYRVIMAVIMAVVIGLAAGLIYLVWRGHRWARILLAALILYGYVDIVSDVPASFALAWYFGVLYLLSLVLDAVTLVLMFTPPANAWFRMNGGRRPAKPISPT